MSTQTRPASGSGREYCAWLLRAGTIASATATATIAVPSQPMRSNIRFMVLAPPPFAVDRFGGQKQSKRNEAQVVNQVRRIEDALSEVVEVIEDRDVLRDLVDRRTREAADPRDDPQQQEHRERHHAGDALILRQARAG